MRANVDKELIKLCENKDVLFLENDVGLYNSVGNFEAFCIENKIKYHTCLDVSNQDIKSLAYQISMHDIIVWESQYTSDISSSLQKLMFDPYIFPKILIECYINEPNWYYKPETLKHRVLVLDCYAGYDNHEPLDGVDEWKLYELKEDHKPIWDKKEDEL